MAVRTLVPKEPGDALVAGEPAQLSRQAVVGVWAAAALPMAAISWIGAPLTARALDGPNTLVRALLVGLTLGLVWQFVLVMILVRREQGDLRWSTLKRALWLRAPQSPRTGRRGGRLWWVTVPLVVAFAAESMLPTTTIPGDRDLAGFLDSPSGEAFFHGAWSWFAVVLVLVAFNTVLGEELLFRGYLLPRMRDSFGRSDWAANGALFAVYHLHTPWVIPWTLLDAFILSYPSRRYRSAVLGIVVHSAQSVVITAIILGLVL